MSQHSLRCESGNRSNEEEQVGVSRLRERFLSVLACRCVWARTPPSFEVIFLDALIVPRWSVIAKKWGEAAEHHAIGLNLGEGNNLRDTKCRQRALRGLS